MTAVEQVRAALDRVVDPELPVLTIADLGVLRDVAVEGRHVTVTITPTYSGCPALQAISDDIVAALDGWDVDVRTVLAPAWTTAWLSEDGRRKLAELGIAPPTRSTGPVDVRLGGLTCPLCGSRDTEELSRFSSTACKSLWRCRSCREPFDHFKDH